MNSSEVGISSPSLGSADSALDTVSTPVLQPKGCLDPDTSMMFSCSLAEALQQATHTVIVDLLWVEEISPKGLAILRHGIQRALQLGKEIVFLSAGQEVYGILMAETMQQRSLQLGQPSIHCRSDFGDFLTRPKAKLTTLRFNAADRPQLEKFYQKPRKSTGNAPVLSGTLYNDVTWANSQQAS